jgi:hypothetical protein
MVEMVVMEPLVEMEELMELAVAVAVDILTEV